MKIAYLLLEEEGAKNNLLQLACETSAQDDQVRLWLAESGQSWELDDHGIDGHVGPNKKLQRISW